MAYLVSAVTLHKTQVGVQPGLVDNPSHLYAHRARAFSHISLPLSSTLLLALSCTPSFFPCLVDLRRLTVDSKR